MLVDLVLAPSTISTAWQWLCQRRKNYPYHADIWHLRFYQQRSLDEISHQLRSGQYRFSPMQLVTKANGEQIPIWSASDALVLKLLTLTLQEVLPLHRSCTHLKGHGGHKYAVRQAHNWLHGGAYSFVCKSDIRGYYANIDKSHLLHLISKYIRCPIILGLLSQFLHYSVESGGNFHTPQKGIPRGCPLSPLLAGFHLYELDRKLTRRKGVRYLRFMDDLLILAQTRWQLKRAVAIMNRWLAGAGLEQHPDKTFIGRPQKGFDWLGYRFSASGIEAVASSVKQHHIHKLQRLFEQARRKGLSRTKTQQCVLEYQKRWHRWCRGGLQHAPAPNYANPWDCMIWAGTSVA